VLAVLVSNGIHIFQVNGVLCMFRVMLLAFSLLSSVFVVADSSKTVMTTNETTSKTATETGNIEIFITNLPNDTAGVIVSIFRGSDSFLQQADSVFYFTIEEIKNSTIFLNNIAHGEFAIGITSDQNGNKILDTKIFGIPNEPVGFTNNPKPRMGPPKYSDSHIKFYQDAQKFTVNLLNT
jgi:uncharacterized protein (DUF2141 family)